MFEVPNGDIFEAPLRGLKIAALEVAVAWCLAFLLVAFATYFWRFGGLHRSKSEVGTGHLGGVWRP